MIRLTEIVGQDAAIASLRRSAASGRLHHTLLFTGPEGVGKRTTALALAAFLFCESTGGDACGRCAACAQVAAGPPSHPDLHLQGLETGDENERKTRVGIDQVREIQAALGRRPLAASRRIAILDDAHLLTHEAQNAFLKTLEEPPGESLLVLVAHNASALLPTVRSRCQRVPFRPLAAAELAGLLRDRFGMKCEDVDVIAAFARGSIGRALSADPERLRRAGAEIAQILEALSPVSYRTVSEGAERLLALDRSGSMGIDLLLEVLRLRLRAGRGAPQAGVELTRSGKTGTLPEALRAVEAAYEAMLDLRRNANKALAVERMLARIAETGRGA